MSFSEYVSFKCIEVTQPIGIFYIGCIDAVDLAQIAYADVRRIEKRDVEKYLGIERPLSTSRVAELKEYVGTVDATFPSSIILAVSSEDAQYDDKSRVMKIKRDANVAKIIDGQHRIAGLEEYSGDQFQLNVTIFIDMDMEDQAMVFATINLKQTKVSKSLAYDLYEFATSRSPQKTCHNIAKLLNSEEGSPFKDKIKILGVATGKSQESLTQATFVERLMPYISNEAMRDRDLIKRGKKPQRATDEESQKLIFKNLFLDDRDAQIARIIWNYFKAVEEKWPRSWRETKRGNLLNRTTGFGALMRFLRFAYLRFAEPGEVVKVSGFGSIFNEIDIVDNSFTPDKYIPGGTGERDLLNDLRTKSGV